MYRGFFLARSKSAVTESLIHTHSQGINSSNIDDHEITIDQQPHAALGQGGRLQIATSMSKQGA